MSEIKRVTDPAMGPLDGVTADVNCVLTQFDRLGEGKGQKRVERIIKVQTNMPCTILCAYSTGTVSFSMRDVDLMVTVRMDELFETLKVASGVAEKHHKSRSSKYTDVELEGKWRELADVLFDEAESPSGLILAEAWWIFPKGVDREDIWHWFDTKHSKGVAYLFDKMG